MSHVMANRIKYSRRRLDLEMLYNEGTDILLV